MNLNDIITPTVVSGLVSALVMTAIKSGIKARFDYELEAAKSGFNHEIEAAKAGFNHELEVAKAGFNHELESAKKDLLIEAKRDEIKFSELRKQQAEVIRDFYGRFAKTYTLAALVVSPVEFDNDFEGRARRFADAFNDLQDYYLTHKIFIPFGICKLIDKFLEEVLNAKHQRDLSRDSRITPQQHIDFWNGGWKTLSETAAEIKVEIEKEFRQLLGMQ